MFLKSPLKTLARTLYSWRGIPASQHLSPPLTVVCISDTHNSQPKIPLGDLLIHAGDLTQGGTAQELQTAFDWVNSLPHAYKVVIAGNHDMLLDKAKFPEQAGLRKSLRWGSINYLENTVKILRFPGGRNLKIYGSPYTRKHGNWGFQYPPGTDVFSATVPEDVDILITHIPPRFHLDVDGFGDVHLLNEVWRAKPKLHVYGHVHEGFGTDVLRFDRFEKLYEDVCRGKGHFWMVVQMIIILLKETVLGPTRESSYTVLINPAAVGGLTDTVKRQPIVIQI